MFLKSLKQDLKSLVRLLVPARWVWKSQSDCYWSDRQEPGDLNRTPDRKPNQAQLLPAYCGERSGRRSRRFRQARVRSLSRAKEHSPAIIFLDEMDGLLAATNRYLAQHDIQLVDQFLTEISGLQPENNIFLVGATDHPDNIDPRVLRGGRFSEKIQIQLPDSDQRAQLLSRYLKGARLEPGLTIAGIAQGLSGMSPADVQAISMAAKRIAFNRLNIGDQLPSLNWSDFEAVERVAG